MVVGEAWESWATGRVGPPPISWKLQVVVDRCCHLFEVQDIIVLLI